MATFTARYFILFLILLACKSTPQASRPDTIISTNNGRAFGLIQTGDAYRLSECPDLATFSASKTTRTSDAACTDYVTDISTKEKQTVEASLRKEIVQLSQNPNMSRFIGQIFPDAEAPLEFLNLALQEFEKPGQDRATNAYIFRNAVNILVEEFKLLRANGGEAPSIFTIPKFFYQAGLIAMLTSRCSHYKIVDPACVLMARKYIEQVDFTIGTGSYNSFVISFPTLTQQYMADAGISSTLELIAKTLPRSSTPIYTQLVQKLGPDKSLEIMATLFQDISKSHLDYLYLFTASHDLGKTLSKNITTTDKIIDRIISAPKLGSLPGVDDPEPEGDRGYHIFVPALAAKNLTQRYGHPELVAQLTFIFNTLYEYAREVNVTQTEKLFADVSSLSELNSSDSNKYALLSEKITNFFAIFQDPVALSEIDAGTKEDLYYGYVAALWGTGRPISGLLNYQEFSELFFKNPYAFIANQENFINRP